jgi:hypothetical protein
MYFDGNFSGNYSHYMRSHNDSYDDQYIDVDLYEKYDKNRAVSDVAYYILITAYTCLIVIGSIGNLMVILAIISNKSKQQNTSFST